MLYSLSYSRVLPTFARHLIDTDSSEVQTSIVLPAGSNSQRPSHGERIRAKLESC